MRRSIRRTERCIFWACQEVIGRQWWMHDHQLNMKKVPSVFLRSLGIWMLVGRRVLPRCRRKPGGRGQWQTSWPRRRGRRRLLLPANQVASSLVMIRPLEHEGPLCSTGLMTMKFRRLLHRARRSLHAALPRGINQGEAKKSLSHRRGKSSSSGRGKFPHSRRWESLRGKRRESMSNRRRGPQSGR